MEELVARKLHEFGVEAGDRVGVAVSGGVDSMALLHCLCNLRAQLNIIFVAFHMEHGIRGQASEDDMRFVMRECEKRGVECIVARAEVPALARERKLSVETAARHARYAFLDAQDANFIVTAHQMDDAAETVLMNLLRGCGLAGLCGIPERRGRYIRPLLGVSRAKIEQYAEKSGVAFVRDATTDETDYTRNYIRSEIMPRLKRINARAAAHIAQTAGRLGEDEAALRQAALDANCIEEQKDAVYIRLDRLASLPDAVKKRVIRLALERRFGLCDVESRHLKDMLELSAAGESGKRLDIGKGLRATVVYGKLMIGRARKKAYNDDSVIFSGPGRYELGDTVLVCSACDAAALGGGAEYFEADALAGAVFRRRREGDRIQPLGMSGTKRLSDYLSDRKVPLHARDDMVVLAVGQDVLWAVGAGVSEKSKIKPGSRIYKIEAGEKRGNAQ
jgi:tRNA(Ile)-lysidine synthase